MSISVGTVLENIIYREDQEYQGGEFKLPVLDKDG